MVSPWGSEFAFVDAAIAKEKRVPLFRVGDIISKSWHLRKNNAIKQLPGIQLRHIPSAHREFSRISINLG